jgi:hypothetical protein
MDTTETPIPEHVKNVTTPVLLVLEGLTITVRLVMTHYTSMRTNVKKNAQVEPTSIQIPATVKIVTLIVLNVKDQLKMSVPSVQKVHYITKDGA